MYFYSKSYILINILIFLFYHEGFQIVILLKFSLTTSNNTWVNKINPYIY